MFTETIERYRAFLMTNPWVVPLAGFLLPFIEALFPSLPLTAIIAVNLGAMAVVYGAVLGTGLTILLAILGSFAGMLLVFLILRRTLGSRFLARIQTNAVGRRFAAVAATGNDGMLLSFLCNPLLPGSIMNYALAFTPISIRRYAWLTGISRIVIILLLVFLGSVFDVQERPANILWLLLGYTAFFLVGYLYKHFTQKVSHPNT